jgi:hypothetical protein
MSSEFADSDQVTIEFHGESDGLPRPRGPELERRVSTELADERDARIRDAVRRAMEQYKNATDEAERMEADDLIWRYLMSRSYSRPLRESSN